jgi:hypothetical protein
MKETNVALATEKLEQQDKISQLELQLNGEENSEMDVKEKSPMAGSGVTPIGGRGKVVRADELIGLSNWLPPVQTLEQAYRWDRELFSYLSMCNLMTCFPIGKWSAFGRKPTPIDWKIYLLRFWCEVSLRWRIH